MKIISNVGIAHIETNIMNSELQELITEKQETIKCFFVEFEVGWRFVKI